MLIIIPRATTNKITPKFILKGKWLPVCASVCLCVCLCVSLENNNNVDKRRVYK